MSDAAIERFRQIVITHPEVPAQLWSEADVEAFSARAVQLGAAYGCTLNSEALNRAVRASPFDIPLLHDPAAQHLAGWVPIRVLPQQEGAVVHWCYMGSRTFSEPFFERSITKCRQHPLNRLLRRQTPITALEAWHADQAGLTPNGFIFHMSRCGSTLIAQMLAALPKALVIAEAEPIDDVLRAHLRNPSVSDAQRRVWLRHVVSALGQRRTGAERAFVVKFDSWSIFDLPLIRSVFPDTPWIFVYRDPLEVMVSQQRQRGSQMIPGVLEPALLGFDPAELPLAALDAYCARVLARVCGAAVQHCGHADGIPLNYRRLPDAVWSSLLALFGIEYAPDDLERMRAVTHFHAKRPELPFFDDTQYKRSAAGNELRALAAQWVNPWYDQLLALEERSSRQWAVGAR